MRHFIRFAVVTPLLLVITYQQCASAEDQTRPDSWVVFTELNSGLPSGAEVFSLLQSADGAI